MADITERSGLLGAPVSDEKIVYATGPPLPPPATRVFMIFVATAVTLFTAGTIFGYAAIKPVFIAEGAYGYLCPPTNETVVPGDGCDAQKLQLDLMFTIASFAVNVAAFPVGLFLDRSGPQTTSVTGSVVLFAGLLFLAMSNDHFQGYIPGYTCLALGGTCMFMSHINFMNLFPSHMGSINGLLTGAFDTSSLIFMIFKVAYFQLGVSLKSMWYGYLVVPTINFLFAINYLSDKAFTPSADDVAEEDDDEASTPLMYNIHDVPSKQQLFTPEYIFVGIFVAIYMLRLNFYIATIGEQLAEHFPGDKDMEIWLNDVFNVVLPVGGIVTIPLVGTILDNLGPPFMFYFLATMQVAFGLVSLVPIWWVQVVNFWIFVIARTCLYAAVADYSGRMFGFKSFGTVYGLLMMIAAFANLIQYPLDNLANHYFNHSFFWVNNGLTILSVFCYILPVYLSLQMRKRYGGTSYQAIE